MLDVFSKNIEKNAIFCDSHIHLDDLSVYEALNECFFASNDSLYYCISSFHDAEKFNRFSDVHSVSGVYKSFGVHPGFPVEENLAFLESLLVSGDISCIGECGFDLFNDEFKLNLEKQKVVWNVQLDFAVKFNVPLIIHSRKAFDLLFQYSDKMKKVPCIVFHSFPGGMHEALGFLGKGIKCYFSFGKQLLKGAKKSIECVKSLPVDKLLFETDAPYQTLKDEKYTSFKDIKKVYECAFSLRNESVHECSSESDFVEFTHKIYENFQMIVHNH